MVEIKSWKNTSDAFNRDPTMIVSRHFILRDQVASSERSVGYNGNDSH